MVHYLMRSRHGSPFEHNYMTFLITPPIFTVRHLMRHRTWSFNEESARYKKLDPRFYVPAADRRLKQVGKPGHYEYVPGDAEDHELVLDVVTRAYSTADEGYSELLDAGIARELARMVLPAATFSTVFATCNARVLRPCAWSVLRRSDRVRVLGLLMEDEGTVPERAVEGR